MKLKISSQLRAKADYQEQEEIGIRSGAVNSDERVLVENFEINISEAREPFVHKHHGRDECSLWTSSKSLQAGFLQFARYASRFFANQ